MNPDYDPITGWGRDPFSLCDRCASDDPDRARRSALEALYQTIIELGRPAPRAAAPAPRPVRPRRYALTDPRSILERGRPARAGDPSWA